MMRADVTNLHVDPVRTETTDAKHIRISHVCYMDYIESKEFLTYENLPQACSTDEIKSKIIIIDESSTDESKS